MNQAHLWREKTHCLHSKKKKKKKRGQSTRETEMALPLIYDAGFCINKSNISKQPNPDDLNYFNKINSSINPQASKVQIFDPRQSSGQTFLFSRHVSLSQGESGQPHNQSIHCHSNRQKHPVAGQPTLRNYGSTTRAWQPKIIGCI